MRCCLFCFTYKLFTITAIFFLLFPLTKGQNSEALIPAGEFQMGDHFGYVDPNHPTDELPLHLVKIDSFYMYKTLITNQQFLSFLNSALANGSIKVQNNTVYNKSGTEIYYYTYAFAPTYSISYNGSAFSVVDFRSIHPAVGVLWSGAAAYCNWLSAQNGLDSCYNLTTWHCDFTKNGYRLPTEAEWEYAGRGGHTSPYLIFPNSNSIDTTVANLPVSGDPYETGAYPYTTPVGFYDGKLKLKTDYNWPGSATNYQTGNGANGFGLYDMQGNVWELINDWYGTTYYSASSYNNPTGPDSGSIMPDGNPCRGMRGGNWFNGSDTTGVNDGYSRVSNRDPSYYRGPLPRDQTWSVVGFRVARPYQDTALPVELISFTAQTIGSSVLLSWITATELNSSEFQIERKSINQLTWQFIGSVFAGGNSNATKGYSYVDKDLAGEYQYRLKIIDNNGTFKFSKIITTNILLPAVVNLQQNYPNPFNPETSIKYSIAQEGHVTLKVFDVLGKEVAALVDEFKQPGSYVAKFSIQNKIESGIYFYQLKMNSIIITKKAVLIK